MPIQALLNSCVTTVDRLALRAFIDFADSGGVVAREIQILLKHCASPCLLVAALGLPLGLALVSQAAFAQVAAAVAAAPEWSALTPVQKAALAPLEAQWSGLSANQQRKWLEVASGFAQLAPQEKAKVHQRMAAWSALSPQQRANARLNFSEAANGLSADERKAKWDAYKALPAEEKQRLRAEGKAEQPKSMALAAKPVSSERIANVPKAPASALHGTQGGPASAHNPGKARPKIEVASSVAAAP
jgi:hypothetical protein